MGDKIFTFRIDENLHEQIKQSAEKNKRSLAKEIEYVLDNYYNVDTAKFSKPPTEKAAQLAIELIKELGFPLREGESLEVLKPYRSDSF